LARIKEKMITDINQKQIDYILIRRKTIHPKNFWVLGMYIGFGYKIFWVFGMDIVFGYTIFLVLGMGIGLGYEHFWILGIGFEFIFPTQTQNPKIFGC